MTCIHVYFQASDDASKSTAWSIDGASMKLSRKKSIIPDSRQMTSNSWQIQHYGVIAFTLILLTFNLLLILNTLCSGVSAPWLLFSQVDAPSYMVMFKDQPSHKVDTLVDGIISVMAIYYTYLLPYPPPAISALLYMQKHVLGDEIHSMDAGTLKKGSRELQRFQKENSKTSIDALF